MLMTGTASPVISYVTFHNNTVSSFFKQRIAGFDNSWDFPGIWPSKFGVRGLKRGTAQEKGYGLLAFDTFQGVAQIIPAKARGDPANCKIPCQTLMYSAQHNAQHLKEADLND